MSAEQKGVRIGLAAKGLLGYVLMLYPAIAADAPTRHVALAIMGAVLALESILDATRRGL